jgi:hypothetical protein
MNIHHRELTLSAINKPFITVKKLIRLEQRVVLIFDLTTYGAIVLIVPLNRGNSMTPTNAALIY